MSACVATFPHLATNRLHRPASRPLVARPIGNGKATKRSPNTAACIERFNQTLWQELVDHFIVFGERHLDQLVSVLVGDYQAASGQGVRPPYINEQARLQEAADLPPGGIPFGEIRCESYGC